MKNNAIKKEIIYCYTSSTKDKITHTKTKSAHNICKRRLLVYKSPCKQKEEMGFFYGRTYRRSFDVSSSSYERVNRLTTKMKTLMRGKYRNDLVAKKIRISKQIFPKLSKLYSESERPLNYSLYRSFNKTFISSVQNFPIEKPKENSIVDKEDIKNEDITEELNITGISFLGDLKRTEKNLNMKIYNIRKKLNKILKKSKDSKSIKARQFKFKNTEEVIDKPSHPTQDKPRSWPASLKLIKIMASLNPLLHIMTWTFKSQSNLIDKSFFSKYLISSIRRNCLPVPLHTNDNILLIDNQYLTKEQAAAIGSIMQDLPSSLTQIKIIAADISDNVLAGILAGVTSSRTINTMILENTSIGINSFHEIKGVMNKRKPYHLSELCLVAVNIPVILFQELFEDTINLKRLAKLTLTRIEFDRSSVKALSKFIEATQNLYYLNLEKLKVACSHLINFAHSLNLNKVIEYLVIKDIPLGSYGGLIITEIKQELMNYLASFIKVNKKLLEFNISYASLSEQEITIIVNAAFKSKSLQSLHLDGNHITKALISSFGLPVNSVNLWSEEEGCVLWRSLDNKLMHLNNVWIISNECFLCSKWKTTVFVTNPLLNFYIPNKLLCDTYKPLEIPFILKTVFGNLPYFIERHMKREPAYNIANPKLIKDPVYYAVLLLPPKKTINYEITFLSEGKPGDIISEKRREDVIVVSPRVGEVKDSSINIEKKLERKFVKAESVFSNWQVDTKDCLRYMIWNDYTRTKIGKCINSHNEAKELLDELYKSAEKIRDLYISLAIKSAYPYISRFHFYGFCKKKDILEKVCTLSDIDRFFIAIGVNTKKTTVTNTCIERSLTRCEFLEILVRIANRKYRETFRVKTHVEAFKMLLNELVKDEDIDCYLFRESKLWQLSVDDLLRGNLNELRYIYNLNSAEGKFLRLENIKNLINVRCKLNIAQGDLLEIYGKSKMTVVDEGKDMERYDYLTFEEFLEFLGRIADRYIEKEEMSITDKFTLLLTRLLKSYRLEIKPPYSPDED